MNASLASGRYTILKKLNARGHAAVFLVEDQEEKRARRTLVLVEALKDAGSERRAAHFKKELEALAKLEHPNLQRILDHGTTDVDLPTLKGRHLYFTAEPADGPDFLRFATRASWTLFAEAAVQALRGIEYLHGQGILHGALRPESIIVTGRGPRKTLKLTDYGLADKGLAGDLAPPRFVAPEVLEGARADRRADLYALGSVLYEAATRTPLAEGKTRDEVRAAAAPRPPRDVKKSTPKAIDELILALVARDPAARPPSANAVIRDLNKSAHKRFSVESHKEAKVATLLAPRFLGRDDELADLEGIAVRALGGQDKPDAPRTEGDDPVLVVVSGEAGTGKTRLVHELKARLGHGPRGVAFVEARAAEGGSPAALELVARALETVGSDDALLAVAQPLARLLDLGVEAPAALEAEDERARVVDAAARTLLACARKKPLLVVLEDLHDADPLSLDVLRLLAHDLRTARQRPESALGEDAPEPVEDATLVALATLSHEELPGKPVERAVRDLVAQEGVRELPLERLLPEAVEPVIASSLGRELTLVRPLAEKISKESDGNLALAFDALSALAEEGKLPPPDGAFKLDAQALEALDLQEGLAGLSRRRLEKLPDDARALVHALSVSPSPCDVTSLAFALEVDPAEIAALGRELERRQMATVFPGADEDEPARLVVESAALRDVALADLGPEEVEAIDDALGRALAQRSIEASTDTGEEVSGRAWSLAEEAARHLLEGSRSRTGVPFALACAQRLGEAGVPERAVELATLALAGLAAASEGGDGDQPIDVARALEDCPAPGFVQKVAASDLELSLLLARGEAWLRTGRANDARSDFDKALAVARARRRPRESVTALLGAGRALAASGEAAKARARFDEAAALAREVDWPRGIALALREAGRARIEAGDLEDAVTTLEQAARIEEDRQDKVALAVVLRDLARALAARGDAEPASERLARARDLDEESERPAGVAASYLELAHLAHRKGEHDRALELARRAIVLSREARDPRSHARALGEVAHFLSARGENDDATVRFEAALELWQRLADPAGSAAVRHDLGLVLAQRGRFDEAQGHLEAAIKIFSQEKRRALAGIAMAELAHVHLSRGDATRARDAVERAASEAEGPRGESLARVVLETTRVRAEIALRQGDLARAEDLARQAADNASRTGEKWVEAFARTTLGSVVLRRGKPAEAEKELKEALGLARSIADRPLEAGARLALADVHVARAEPHGALAEVEAARDTAQRTGDAELEVRSLLAWGKLHAFLGQARRAEQVLEQARVRAQQLGLGLVRPEVTLARVEASQEARAAEKLEARSNPLKKPPAPSPEELSQIDALLEEADRDARATSRRSLHAEVDLARAQEELLRGQAAPARERAEAALESAKIADDVALAVRAEVLVAEARLALGRADEARASAERAIGLAEQASFVEPRARALLARARALDAQDAPRAAARDLREAASLVRAAWAAIPEELRATYGKKALALSLKSAADLIVARAAQAAPRPDVAAAPAAKANGGGPAAAQASKPAPAPAREGDAPDSPADTAKSGDQVPVALETLKDPLTSLYNHTYFTAQLEIEIRRSHRHSRPLSLLKVNIDRFKLVRELYGPRTGKRIIKEVASVLVRNVRDVDVVARYFGDEFEVLLPDTDVAGAMLTSDRLRQAVEQTNFQHEGEKIDLTISVGITTFPTDAKDKDALICRVDEALYNARAKGPNQSFAFSQPEEKKEPAEVDRDLRELDSLMLSREGRLILSMVNRVVSTELDLDRVIGLVTGMVVEATRGERGFFMLKDRNGELQFKHGRNIDDKEILSPELKISHGIAREVARSGEPIVVEEALDDNRFRDFKSVMDLKLRSIICAPIKSGPGEVLGVIYVDHNSIARHFSKEELNFLTAIAQRIAIPIKNSKTLRDTEEQLEELRDKLKTSQDQLETKYKYDKIIGQTEPMQRIYKLLDRIVETHHSVVIHGESGTGKELIARAIHYNGPRKHKPFVAENCAALTDTLLEAELFGHVKGAFTGADKDSKGLFELANGGTLFLDEIGDMSERMQKKLLRVLQEGEVRPVGGKRVMKVDVRIISASNKDLKKLVQERKFREDLYYRLNVITVNLPALRERREDIPLLVDHFMKKICGDQAKAMERDVLRLLVQYDWPGNVRELENEINRMVAMSDTRIDAASLSPKIREGSKPEVSKDDGLGKYYDRPLKEVEFEVMRDIILKTLERTNWHRTKAAKILKVPTSTLFNKMKKYGIG